ncbi:hypothetical protein [Candidatus Kryptobacter tengchongensis]|uniref:hypothetical protein n=1 Tax=Kryptobacter tengchongensis TaxID=1643429 RepID=UPI00070798EF|nr:hypothetical protein [Candidatus Kryptobacter tengchongensis]CUS80420.1 hypothetical protein JGI20_00053 [Candidatus Kryptobacter tengchongensis]CUS99387.1 hypothetical protein JGI22_00437 [Candidatus Kryptobacter tengchongensis]
MANATSKIIEAIKAVILPEIEVIKQDISKLHGRMDEFSARLSDTNAYINEISRRIDELRTELYAKIDEMRAELYARIDGLRAELYERIDGLRTELNARIDETRSELSLRIDDTNKRIDNVVFMINSLVEKIGELTREVESLKKENVVIGDILRRLQKIEDKVLS